MRLEIVALRAEFFLHVPVKNAYSPINEPDLYNII